MMSSLPSASTPSEGTSTTTVSSFPTSADAPPTLPPSITTIEELRKRHEHERWYMESQIKQLSRPRLGKKPLTPEQINEQKQKLEIDLVTKHQKEEELFFRLYPPSTSSSSTNSVVPSISDDTAHSTTVPSKDESTEITATMSTTSIHTSPSSSTPTTSVPVPTPTLSSSARTSTATITIPTATASPTLTPEEAAIAARKAKAQRKRNKKASKYQFDDSDDEETKNEPKGPTKKEIELQQLKDQLDPLGYEVRTVAADGNCLFRAIADQLRIQTVNEKDNGTRNEGVSLSESSSSSSNLLTSTYDYSILRTRAAEYIRSRWQEFAPFLPYEPNDQYPENNPEDTTLLYKAVVNYCDRFSRTACWGGHPEIRALSSSLGVPIIIYQANSSPMEFLPSGKENLSLSSNTPTASTMILRLSYHKFYLTLGEHYNSVIPKHGSSKNNIASVNGDTTNDDNEGGWEQRK